MLCSVLSSLRNQTIVVPPSSSIPPGGEGGNPVPSKAKSNTGAIVGGIIGGLVALVVAVSAVVLFRRWRSRHEKSETAALAQAEPFLYVPSQDVPTTTGAPEHHASVGSRTITAAGEKGAIGTHIASTTTRTDPPTTFTLASVSSQGPASSHDPPSSSSDPVISPSDVRGLMTEMENLRRAMQGITVESAEPPPTYEG